MSLSRPWRSYSTITLKISANGIKVSSKNAASEIYLHTLKAMKSVFLCIFLHDQLILESLMGAKFIVNSKEIFYPRRGIILSQAWDSWRAYVIRAPCLVLVARVCGKK